MTIQELSAYLQENPSKAQEFETLMAKITAKTDEERCEALSKAATEIGCDVSPLEFALRTMKKQPLDGEALDKVTGGTHRKPPNKCISYSDSD